MTMTNVAAAQGSLGALSAMLSPNMYHSRHGLSQNSASPTPGKGYDTLGKGGKKSWSVRLGLSRQNQHLDDRGKNWGTLSNGNMLSRQMIYGDPWLYGTVRLNQPGAAEPRAFASTSSGQQNITSSAVLPGTPVLVVCSCPEFLNGTTRKLGNCRRCGGHRWVGVPLGGTCRLTPSSSRCRPSLAGMLRRTSMDDPYDQMRRNRLESRPRAQNVSPHKLSSQRDLWNESITRGSGKRNDQGAFIDRTASNSNWYDKTEPSTPTTAATMLTTSIVTLSTLITTPALSLVAPLNTIVTPTCSTTTTTTTIVTPEVGQASCAVASSDCWLGSRNPRVNDRCQYLNIPKHERCANVASHKRSKDEGKQYKAGDSRKSILECDVNPYLLLRKRAKDEDDLSDELSDNALEEDGASLSFNLFDSSKVRSIERIPARNSVAAISGQRVRVFNERREETSDDEVLTPITRIPIPKISPKRPPRRLKETAKRTIKSILKGGINENMHQRDLGRGKSVLFNVDNVIFAPEKPTDRTWLAWDMINNGITCYEKRKGHQAFSSNQNISDNKKAEVEKAKKNDKSEPVSAYAKHKFITIPNIRNSRINKDTIKVPKNIEITSLPDGIKSDKLMSSKRYEFSRISTNVRQTRDAEASVPVTNTDSLYLCTHEQLSNEKSQSSVSIGRECKPSDYNDMNILVKNSNVGLMSNLTVDEKDLILKSKDRSRNSCLIRSRSDLSSYHRHIVSTDDVFFMDTMRISVCRRNRDVSSLRFVQSPSLPIVDTPQITIETEEEPAECVANESNPAIDATTKANDLFQRMRPTNWSPPPQRQNQRCRALKSMTDKIEHNDSTSALNWVATKLGKSDRRNEESWCRRAESPTSSALSQNSSNESPSCSDVTTGLSSRLSDSNICKITVSPQTSPMVHRLCIGPDARDAKRTSITINSDPVDHDEVILNNKVTISVGGEDSTCNPTVICVNNSSPPRNQSLADNRTLVILGNCKSNVIVKSRSEDDIDDIKIDERNENRISNGDVQMTKVKELELQDFRNNLSRTNEDGFDNKEGSMVQQSRGRAYEPFTSTNLVQEQDCTAHNDNNTASCIEQNKHFSKEAVISKLLEDSLKKAKENGEILDENNGEAIIKILKQSLLKDKQYSKPVTGGTNGQQSSIDTNTSDLISMNLYFDENPYEIIKEPIYEEIPDELPPPLPLSPPPSGDYFKDRMYFGEMDFYKLNSYAFISDAYNKTISNDLIHCYDSKNSGCFFKRNSVPRNNESTPTKFKLLNFLMDAKGQPASLLVEDEDDEEDDDDADVDDDEDNEEEEDADRDLEALYGQKETSLGDLSSKSSQISNVSDSSEECNIVLTGSSDAPKVKNADIERTDSGVGSESSQASSTRGVVRRWRSGIISSGSGNVIGSIPQVISMDAKFCEDCEQRLEPLITDSGVVYAPFVCRKCSKKRAERKGIITEIVETEQKYGRDLKIILEEFHRPMLRAGLLTSEQLLAIFLNVEELLEHNLVLAEKLKDAVEYAQKSGDEDLLTVDLGKIFLESERMLHAFENYCTRQGSASLLLQNLEKEKELLRIFLKVSQMENAVLRRMNLNSFLMVPVQRVTKYPLLLARLLKATPSLRADIQEAKKRLKQAQTNVELHLEHMNAEAKDVTSTKLWRRISIIQNGRRSIGEQDMVNIKLRKMAVEVLEWAHEETRFVLEGRLLIAQPTDNNWRRGRTIKLVPVTAMLVINGKPNAECQQFPDDSLFSRYVGVNEATLLLVKEKFGRCTLLREPLYLDKCIVYCETDLEDYFEIQELSSKETFIFKAEDGDRTKKWCRTLQVHAQSLGAWRKRRGALPNIMICGVTRN